MKNTIKKIIDYSDKVLEFAGSTFLLAMIIIVSLQVFTRYFFKITPRWSEETTMILMIWFGFIGIAIGVKKDIHLSIEFLVNKFPEKIKKGFYVLDDVLVGIFGFTLLVYGAELVQKTGDSTLPATQLPTYVLYIMVPITGFMIVLYTIDKIFRLFENEK